MQQQKERSCVKVGNIMLCVPYPMDGLTSQVYLFLNANIMSDVLNKFIDYILNTILQKVLRWYNSLHTRPTTQTIRMR